MRKRALVASLVCLPLLGGAAHASPINLVTNGSFEGAPGLTGWTVTGGGAFPVSVVTTATACCFGETVPNDNIVGGSPDAAGNHGVYFVDDIAHQTLTQSVALTVGTYEVGFDAYSPFNGFNNRGDAAFHGTIAGVALANYTVHGSTPGGWIHFSGLASILADGNYDVAFDFQPTGTPSADVVIDRVYIVASDLNGGTPIGGDAVPEPATLSLLGLGTAGLIAKRRKRATEKQTEK
jgi:hypothetical protein